MPLPPRAERGGSSKQRHSSQSTVEEADYVNDQVSDDDEGDAGRSRQAGDGGSGGGGDNAQLPARKHVTRQSSSNRTANGMGGGGRSAAKSSGSSKSSSRDGENSTGKSSTTRKTPSKKKAAAAREETDASLTQSATQVAEDIEEASSPRGGGSTYHRHPDGAAGGTTPSNSDDRIPLPVAMGVPTQEPARRGGRKFTRTVSSDTNQMQRPVSGGRGRGEDRETAYESWPSLSLRVVSAAAWTARGVRLMPTQLTSDAAPPRQSLPHATNRLLFLSSRCLEPSPSLPFPLPPSPSHAT